MAAAAVQRHDQRHGLSRVVILRHVHRKSTALFVVVVGIHDADVFAGRIRTIECLPQSFIVTLSDIVQGSVKAAVFGLILTHIGTYKGYNTSGGAEGVGKATTEAVVMSAVLILLTDYLITVFWEI